MINFLNFYYRILRWVFYFYFFLILFFKIKENICYQILFVKSVCVQIPVDMTYYYAWVTDSHRS